MFPYDGFTCLYLYPLFVPFLQPCSQNNMLFEPPDPSPSFRVPSFSQIQKSSRKGRQPLKDTDHRLLENGRRQATLTDLFTHQHFLNLCSMIGALLGDTHMQDRQLCVCSLTQLCLTLCDPMDCSPPGSSAHGILQARIREWVARPSSRGSSQPRDQTRLLHWQADSLPVAQGEVLSP